MAKLLAKYTNGNYVVRLFDDGTKIRMNNLDNLTPNFAESIDLEITSVCNGNCGYCYMNCTPQGQHANLNDPILDTLHPGTELAINGNDLTHPDLENFLTRMRDKGVIVNMTVNQKHLTPNIDKLIDWQDKKLLWGIGVSLIDSSDPTLIENINKLQNVVLHVIDGLFTKEDMENLKDKGIKLLMLGYKHVGRGIQYYEENKETIDSNIAYLRENLFKNQKWFNGIGFDNLSLEHLDIKSQVSEEDWNIHFMGAEGSYTFFLDLVHKQFAVSSLDTTKYDALDSVDEMFHFIRKQQEFE